MSSVAFISNAPDSPHDMKYEQHISLARKCVYLGKNVRLAGEQKCTLKHSACMGIALVGF